MANDTTDAPGVLNTRREYDLANTYQRREVAGLIYLVASRVYDGRLAPALMGADRPYDWSPAIDGRSKEARALREAEKSLWAALVAYDSARLAAKAKAKARR